MGRRFSDLEKSVLAILANGGNPLTSSDEAVRRYWEWKVNPSSPAHNLPETSTRTAGRRTDPRFIQPFSVDLAVDQFAKVQLTRRTQTGAPAGLIAAMGYRTLTGTQRSIGIKRFKPAQVYWRNGAAENSSPARSRITNRPYKTYYTGTDQGYVASFGQVGAETVQERQRAITTALGTAINLITFSPEKYAG